MKHTIVLIITFLACQACYVKYPKRGQTDSFSKNQMQGIAKDTYVLLDNIQYKRSSVRGRILVFGIGGSRMKEEAYRREMAYSEALQTNGIDGIVNPTFRTKYWKIPFILFPPFGITSYSTTVYGRGYKMK